MKFGVISDCQYADIDSWKNDEFDRRFRESPRKLEEAIEFFNDQDLEFVIHLGDLIDQGIENLDLPLEILKKLKHKIYHVLGNHDFYVTDEVNPKRISAEILLDKLSMPAKYYSFVAGKQRFLVLDSNEVGMIEWEQGTPEYEAGLKAVTDKANEGLINGKSWNGAFSAQQMAWIDSELELALQNNQRVVFFVHHPIYPKHRENLLNFKEVLKMFTEKPQIIAYMNGHNHAGNYGEYDGVQCITFKGMVETATNAFAVVEIDEQNLNITGYGRQESNKYRLRNS